MKKVIKRFNVGDEVPPNSEFLSTGYTTEEKTETIMQTTTRQVIISESHHYFLVPVVGFKRVGGK